MYTCMYCTCTLTACILHPQLLVGSEDFDIRVFKEDEIIAEMTETEVSRLKNGLSLINFF